MVHSIWHQYFFRISITPPFSKRLSSTVPESQYSPLFLYPPIYLTNRSLNNLYPTLQKRFTFSLYRILPGSSREGYCTTSMNRSWAMLSNGNVHLWSFFNVLGGGGVWFSISEQNYGLFSDEGNNNFVTKHFLMTWMSRIFVYTCILNK